MDDPPRCATCSLWVFPSWPTGGFGTCHLPSTLRDEKRPPLLLAQPERSYVTTRGEFGCVMHRAKEVGRG